VSWVRALLRGQKVYARADDQGRLKVERGRVEIRYKPNDGRRYDARADNLTVVEPEPLPDDTCGEIAATAGAGGATGAARGRAKKESGMIPPPVPEGAVIAYADGACSGNPGPAGLGVVVIDGDDRIEISEYLGDNLTNNIAELTAVLRVLDEVDDPKRPLVIHTDSQYTIGVVDKGWKAKANFELVSELRDALRGRRNTNFVYVRGHSGIPLNERADALAREAVQQRRTRRELIRPSAAISKVQT